MAATADDFYCHGSTTPTADAPAGRVFAALEAKRAICKRRCNVDSEPSKAVVYSPAADLSAAPNDIPGSPNFLHEDVVTQERGRCRASAFICAGVVIGEPDECSATLLKMLQQRLAKPLSYIAAMQDVEHVPHAAQLAVNLIRLVAQTIPNYWHQCMPPGQTAAATEWADGAVSSALGTLLHLVDSPDDRARVVAACIFLPLNIGGLGFVRGESQRASAFAATFVSVWPTCRALCPALATTPVTADSSLRTVAAFCSAWEQTRSLLASVRARYAALDRDTRVWVDGTTHSAHHPRIPRDFNMPHHADLFGGAERTSPYRCTQRSLSAVTNGDAWLNAKQVCVAFDAANAGEAAVRNRESVRLVSCSQAGAGAWAHRLPDPSVRGSIVHSGAFVIEAQRHIGAYLSALAPTLRAAQALGHHVTQHQFLGDEAINAANHSHRHAATLRAIFTALTSLSVANEIPGQLRLGDRGDGTAAGVLAARQRFAHINAGHVPDIIRHGARLHCYELKCYSPFHTAVALGHGSRECGGAASTADGGDFAFGNTEEALIVIVLGVPERGAKADGPMQRAGARQGEGWVCATTDHDYADALGRGTPCTLLVTETTGALSPNTVRMLLELAKQAKAPTTHDSTIYGTSKTSPSTYLAHHLAAISSAIVFADATSVMHAAAVMSFRLSMGLAP